MEDNPLLNYFVRNGGRVIHKWVHYFEAYHRVMNPFRAKKQVFFLEIGIQNGGCAAMWREYFGPESLKYVGVDIDPRCAELGKEGYEIVIGDQGDPAFWKAFRETHSRFDIILDDGGHTMDQQRVTFLELFPILSDGGIFVIEDTHTSYIPGFGGGIKRPGSFIEFVKNLIDEMHGWYFQGDDELARNNTCRLIHSITFFDSIVVIEKRLKNPPLSLGFGNIGHVSVPQVMGPRFYTGINK